MWFTLGYEAGKIDDHVLAAHAFRQCVILEPDVSYGNMIIYRELLQEKGRKSLRQFTIHL